MFCSKCGSLIPDGAQNCPNCQANLAVEPQPENNPIENYQTANIASEASPAEAKGFSITSLILGIVGFPSMFINGWLTIICGTLAIIFGIIGRKKGGKAFGTAGLILGIIQLSLLVLIVLLGFIFAMSLVSALV